MEATLARLSEADLDRRGAQEGWTIREIVHHLAEAEAMQATFILKIGLLCPGYEFDGSWHPGNRRMATAFSYATRPIATSLALFRANRNHVLQTLSSVKPAWNSYVTVKESPEAEGVKVAQAIG